ncbi:MAG: hypothetical protein J5I90_06745 [Caldilineales bacterium]|nr:hypothetical protein [Caldilineales bacterium]
MNDIEHRRSARNALSVVLYVGAGLALALGVLLLVALIGAAQAVMGYDIFFQLGGFGQLAQAILRPLQSGLITVGVILFAIMAAIAGLLFTGGRLAARQAGLAERVRLLEEQMAIVRNRG